ncbi:MAG TPA: glycosyltransferase family 2 protein [Armatimonadota bacterium]|nr:glycosyltransferase family 2 protein [Armatimonadota bacterium]
MPHFSVVIPAYNRARFLPECLDSVLAQTFTDWECIVVDDGSTDGTRELVADYIRRDSRFRYHWQENAGASAARNAGIERATSEWIAFLDSDDYYWPEGLSTLRLVATLTGASIVCGMLSDADPGRLVPEELQVSIADQFLAVMAFRGVVPPLSMSSSAIRRDVVDTVGTFSRSHGTAEDREFWIRATARFPVGIAFRPVAHYRIDHGHGKTDAHFASGAMLYALRRIFREVIQNPVVEARLRSDPASDVFYRLHQSHLLCLDAAIRIRAGEMISAASTLSDAAVLCHTADELYCLIRELAYFLTFPRSDPYAATLRCSRWLVTLARETARSGDRRLTDALLVRASDAIYYTARQLRRSCGEQLAWRTVIAGLRVVPTIRSAKSFLRFLAESPRHTGHSLMYPRNQRG